MSILDEILATKRRELARAQESEDARSLGARAEACEDPTRDLRGALREGPRPRVVAEIKRRSPSRGLIRPDLDPEAVAEAYAAAGAAAISVLTDASYFGGEPSLLRRVRGRVGLPLLRKDFLVDPYQVDESRVLGADAILLIVAALEPPALRLLLRRAGDLALAALVEVHNETELDTALAAGADLVGINNRNLRTFEVDLGVTERLAPKVPEGVIVVAESGVFRYEEVRRAEAAGAHAVLVGEALMRERDVGHALRKLRGTT